MPQPDSPSEQAAGDAWLTSASLLAGDRANDQQAWQRLVEIYTPLVRHWCGQAGLTDHDSADVVQETFRAAFQAIARFRNDRPQDSFRGWLRTIARNKVRDHFRARVDRPLAAGGTEAQNKLAAVPDLVEPLSSADNEAEVNFVYRGALEVVRAEFTASTWQAFWKTVVENRTTAEVATELKLSHTAIFTAKSRVLRRLREMLQGIE